MNISVPRSLVILTLLASLGGCGETVLAPIGPVGAAERTILLDAVAIMLAIVVPTIVATLAFAWWFRAGNSRARYLPTWQYSGQLELLVWSVPALVVLFLGGIAWISSHELDPARPLTSAMTAAPAPAATASADTSAMTPASMSAGTSTNALAKAPAETLEIEVVSLDWKWLFVYPAQQVASINRMVVPIGVPLHLRVTSATVMNVFFVPRLGSEIYSMGGMATQLNLQADQPGTYPGLSANFSGDGFSDMSFALEAVDSGQFDAWVATTKNGGGVLDDAAYRGLLRQSENVQPYTYRGVDAGLFNRIVSMQLPPGEGPQTGHPSPSVKPVGPASTGEH
jgi:cytochrome o ubiquinol oxidase subunit II